MTLDEFRDLLRQEEALDREALAQVIAERPDGHAVVGKHEAKNHVHLRAVIAEAQDACPRAAETIRWLLWHGVLDAQRVMLLAEDIEASPMRPMKDAPRDGTPVLVKIKNDLSPWGIKPGDFGNTSAFAGLQAVMRNRGDIMGWCFAAPVGRGGFSDEWLDGWWPLPVE